MMLLPFVRRRRFLLAVGLLLESQKQHIDAHEKWARMMRRHYGLDGPERTSGHDAWWTIHGEELAAALNRVADGDSPALVYGELYANIERDE